MINLVLDEVVLKMWCVGVDGFLICLDVINVVVYGVGIFVYDEWFFVWEG